MCYIVVPQPGIRSVPPALGAQGLDHWGSTFFLKKKKEGKKTLKIS